ncbi:MAG: GTPase HflX [Candidatus Omnitrophota bacterium]
MERALLVTIDFKEKDVSLSIEEEALELEGLSLACNVEVIDNLVVFCHKPTPNFLIGRGKVEEIRVLADELGADVIILSQNLSGAQQRNLEEVWKRKTIDRSQLILDIFARRAKSPEGKMQVELAQLEYLMPRLIGKGLILSQQAAGLGTSGPGEKKLEVDRRRIRDKINKLKKSLKSVGAHRALLRKKRKNELLPLVVLVGYTSAGKSTLLNALTKAGQVVSERIFTTLDPLAKGLKLANGTRIVLSDTVGFLRGLPHNLIEAFKATLEEVSEADLLIHVLDASSPNAYSEHNSVMKVLKELNADTKPIITALNKIDLVDDLSWINTLSSDFIHPVAISAQLETNLPALIKEIEALIPIQAREVDLLIPHTRMDLLDLIYKEGRVDEVQYIQKGAKVKARVSSPLYERLIRVFGVKNYN